MSVKYDKDMVNQINAANMQMKLNLERVSKIRVECAELRVELSKLYKPECLKMLELLKEIMTAGDDLDIEKSMQ